MRVVCSDVSVWRGRREVVSDVSLDAGSGSWVAVVGPNGAGKSTLLKALAGLVPCTGSVELDGTPIRNLSSRERARRIAVVAQSPVIPQSVSVAEYVRLGRTPHLGFFEQARVGDRSLVAETLADVDAAHLTNRRIETLSGGERQRVVLARALVQTTPVLLLDEPTTALDLGHQQGVLELIDAQRRARGLTVISTMHDLTAAASFADTVVLLVDGAVAATGPASQVLTETALQQFYGANVRVLTTEDGLVVVPRRTPQ